MISSFQALIKQKENLVFNLNRLFVGLFLLIFISIFYFFKFDYFFYLIISLFVFYEIYLNKIIDYKNLFLTIIIYISLLFLFFNFSFFIFFLLPISTVLIFLSILSNSNKSLYFSYFLIFFILIFFSILLSNRDNFYFIILISFINDSVAYFFGNLIKGPLIAKKISPKKTWSGSIFAFSITTVILFYFGFNIFIAIFISILLYLGDLYFSYIKRSLKIKDFSKLLSAHGGILDRIDSMSFFTIFFSAISLL